MLRQAVPKLVQKLQPFKNSQQYVRRFYYRPSRYALCRPWGMRRPLDDFFDRTSRSAFDSMAKNMERMFDDMFTPWTGYRGPGMSRVGAKEVETIYNAQQFEVKLDVSNFTPEELNLKLLDNKVEVSGKHSEKADDYGYVSREFTRQFLLPEDVDVETLESVLTDDGYLVITGKVKGSENVNERVINIKRETQDKGTEEKSS